MGMVYVQCPQKPEVEVRSLGTRVIDDCEPQNVGARNQASALWINNKFS